MGVECNKAVFHNTTPDVQDQDEEQYRFFWSEIQQLFQSAESRLTLEQTTYACGRGRHCEFIQESAGQGIGHLKFNELLSRHQQV